MTDERTVRAAEDWWHHLPPDRKVQVHRWLNPELYGQDLEIPGQLSIPVRGPRPARPSSSSP